MTCCGMRGLFVNRLHRAGRNLLLTGRNAHLLSSELATHLTGRHMPIPLLPFPPPCARLARAHRPLPAVSGPEGNTRFMP